MRIVVLTKPVPDPASGGERLGPDGRLVRTATPAVISFDTGAAVGTKFPTREIIQVQLRERRPSSIGGRSGTDQ